MFSLDAVALEGEKVGITEELYRGEIELDPSRRAA